MEKTKNKKRQGRSLFKWIIYWLHLWLGLISGLLVFIISITGCIYVFEREIKEVTRPYLHVKPQDKPFLPPSQLRAIAAKYAFNGMDTGSNRISGVQYFAADRAAAASYMKPMGKGKEKDFTLIYMNPYTGEVLKQKSSSEDFFRFILEGHFYLWLPHKIGQPIVATSVLIFVIMLITGLIMWWPKNLKKANADKSFKVKWTARFKRLNYDLHNVLGFYVWALAMIIALTGLVWGFKWFAKSLYWVTSGGKTLPNKREKSVSDTTKIAYLATPFPEDQVWVNMNKEYAPINGSLTIQFPEKAADVIGVTYNPDAGTYHRREIRRFDRYTLEEIKLKGIYNKKFEASSTADKINRMNYDIHVGAILGLPGKILAFFASLICASLPVTGTIIYIGRKKKKKRSAAPPTRAVVQPQSAVEMVI